MKKIFTLLAISLVLALPIVSCSADDESAKQAQTDRDSLEIPADQDNSSIQHNQLALYASATNVNVGTLVSFTTVLNGVDVTNEVTYYVNNLPVGGSSITSTLNGTFSVQAKLEGYIDSPIVTVVYGGGTNPNPNPTGNFIFNGEGYNVVANILILNQNVLNDDEETARSEWTSMVVNTTDLENVTVGAMINFTTPFTITDLEEGLGTINYPNGTNETYSGLALITVNDFNMQNQIGTGTVHYTNTFDQTAATNTFTSTITFGSNNLQINYNGNFQHIDNSQNARPSAKMTSNIVKLTNKKNINITKFN